MKLLDGRSDTCQTTWIKKTGPRVLQPQPLDKPKPDCIICGKKLLLQVNTHTFTVGQLFKQVLKKKLGMNEPCVDVVNFDAYIGLEEDIKPKNLAKALKDMKIQDTAFLSVDDYSQQLTLSIQVSHREDIIPEDETADAFVITGEIPSSSSSSSSSFSSSTPSISSSISELPSDTNSKSKKGKRKEIDDIEILDVTQPNGKKQKMDTSEIILIT